MGMTVGASLSNPFLRKNNEVPVMTAPAATCAAARDQMGQSSYQPLMAQAVHRSLSLIRQQGCRSMGRWGRRWLQGLISLVLMLPGTGSAQVAWTGGMRQCPGMLPAVYCVHGRGPGASGAHGRGPLLRQNNVPLCLYSALLLQTQSKVARRLSDTWRLGLRSVPSPDCGPALALRAPVPEESVPGNAALNTGVQPYVADGQAPSPKAKGTKNVSPAHFTTCKGRIMMRKVVDDETFLCNKCLMGGFDTSQQKSFQNWRWGWASHIHKVQTTHASPSLSTAHGCSCCAARIRRGRATPIVPTLRRADGTSRPREAPSARRMLRERRNIILPLREAARRYGELLLQESGASCIGHGGLKEMNCRRVILFLSTPLGTHRCARAVCKFMCFSQCSMMSQDEVQSTCTPLSVHTRYRIKERWQVTRTSQAFGPLHVVF